MAFRSGVFTSTSVTVNGDGIPVGNKAITAADFAKRFYHIYGDGISLKPTSAFYVTPKSGLIATVAAGWGMMSGYDFEETTNYDITMTSSTSAQTLYIGVRLDVATGEFTGNHVAARTTFVAATDRVFAIIVIPANAVTLTTAMITDTRYSATYCGTIDAERVALAALATEYEEALETLTETGVPVHASTHGSAGSDAVTPAAIGAAASKHKSNHAYGGSDVLAAADIGQYGVAALTSASKIASTNDTYTIAFHNSNYTLASGDQEHILHASADVTINYTIPPNVFTGVVIIPFYVISGSVTFVAGSGVTLEKVGGYATVAGLNIACIIQRATNYWVIVGGTQ